MTKDDYAAYFTTAMTEDEYAAYFTPEFRRYIASAEYKERLAEYDRRVDSGTLTVEEAAAILQIPIDVFCWNYVRMLAEACRNTPPGAAVN